jgi:hypothetical protein
MSSNLATRLTGDKLEVRLVVGAAEAGRREDGRRVGLLRRRHVLESIRWNQFRPKFKD